MKISTDAVSRALRGTWLDYPGGGRFLIASTQTPAYRKALFRDVANPAQRGQEDLAKTDDALKKVVAKTLVLGWEDGSVIITKDGVDTELEYSPANALRLVTEFGPWSEEFLNWVSAEAKKIANFEAQEESAAVDATKSGA